MDPETFRHYGYQFIDWLADYYENIENLRVKPQVQPGDIFKMLPPGPPQEGESMDHIFDDFRQLIIPGMTHWQHPGWFAYFPANNSPESVLAELLTAGLGAQCMVWQTSPAAAELEEMVMSWLAQMLNLPTSMHGVIQDTASTATLCALLSAREKAGNFEINKRGLHLPLRVYASGETHSSIEKGVKIAGYGKENLRLIGTDENFAMDPAQLEQAIIADVAAGLTPAIVVATLGTTSSMAMDPVEQIADICSRYKVWLHVDAAFAGTAAIVPELRGFMKGVEQADSFVFNPHKWMLTNFDCSAYFVKDKELLIRTFEIHPEYLKTAADKQVNNYRDWGIQLGRRFRALKLWFVIRSYGVEGLRQMVRTHVELALRFSQWVDEHPDFERLAPTQLSLVCFRYNPGAARAAEPSHGDKNKEYTSPDQAFQEQGGLQANWQDEEKLTDINKKLLEAVNASGEVFLTHTVLKGKFAIRLLVGQRTTAEKHVEKAWQLIREKAGALKPR